MISRYLNAKQTSPGKHKVDGRWRGAAGDILVEIKRTNNVRDVRNALVALAYELRDDAPTTTALCVVTQSKLSPNRLADEIDQFREVVRPDLAHRIHLLTTDEDGQLRGSEYASDPEFNKWLMNLVAEENSTIAPGRSNQQSVTSMLVQLSLRGCGPQTFKALQEACGASYPTVAATVKELSAHGFIEHQSDRRIVLKYLTPEAWLKIARAHGANRKVLRFVDPTGQARTPEAMAKRLFKLQDQGVAKHVAVGGVLGAMHYFPDLDITASPRLDLTIYGQGTDFIQKLDAALALTSDPQAKAIVVVHLTPEPPRFIEQLLGATWASELECIADLTEMGLTREVIEMVSDLNRRKVHAKEGRTP
jgi:DNA-binding MarR family transcriptional regulator